MTAAALRWGGMPGSTLVDYECSPTQSTPSWPPPELQRLELHLCQQAGRAGLQLVALPLQLEIQVQRRALQRGRRGVRFG